jgi:hypothetical protein
LLTELQQHVLKSGSPSQQVDVTHKMRSGSPRKGGH